MKLLSYIFTNTLTTWKFYWKLFLIIFIPVFVAGIAGIFWFRSLTNTTQFTQFLSGANFQSGLSDFKLLKTDEFISLSSTWFQTNKSGMLFEDGNFLIQSITTWTCEDAFSTSSKDGLMITPNAVCIRNNNKQQIVTVAQILTARKSLQVDLAKMDDGKVAQILAPYTGINSLIQWDTLYIDANVLQLILTQEIPQLLNDPTIQTGILKLVKMVSLIAILPFAIFLIVVVAFVVLIYLLTFMLYSLFTQFIYYCMKKPISFKRAFSISWIPYLFIIIVTDWLFSIYRVWWTLLYAIIIIILNKIHEDKKLSEFVSSQTAEIPMKIGEDPSSND